MDTGDLGSESCQRAFESDSGHFTAQKVALYELLLRQLQEGQPLYSLFKDF